jgi:beta-lactamase superfamily II metal-dependent hydrolase
VALKTAAKSRGRPNKSGDKQGKKATAGRMVAPKSGVKVRMYRQGHGDCFLLAFPGKGNGSVYVLIDCGYKPGSNGDKYHLKSIQEIVDDIKVATNKRLDLVIITHEHQDHVNGLWKQTAPYFGDFEIGAAWFAWTESPDDDLAKELRKRYGDQLLGLVAARNRLAASGELAAVTRIDDLLSFELGVDPPQFAAQAAAKKKDPEASINKQGMKLIKDKAGKKNTKYVLPHKEIMHIPGVDGVRVFAFGPPHQADLLTDTDPRGQESFPGHGLRARSSFFAAAEASGASDAQRWRYIQPFSHRFVLPFADAFSHAEHGAFFREHYGNAADPPQANLEEECSSNAEWRRIDHDWLYSAETLALDINEGINNTSLVLAFELPKSKKVLLFIGDAQRGNWKSWTGGSWKDDDSTITVRDLMSRTVLYKVGHHGSHNATLKGTVQDDYPNLSWMGHGKYGSEFVAMITAVNKWALSTPKPPWVHPLPSIKSALLEKCQGRVFQTDTAELAAPAVPDVDWNDFLQRTYIDDLYFEYEVRDL